MQSAQPPSGDTIIVANRLPMTRTKAGAPWRRSPGGLVSALAPIARSERGLWVGASDAAQTVPRDYDGWQLAAVQVSGSERRAYYDGFANRSLWPLYHDAIRAPEFDEAWWDGYRAVNARFAETIADVAGDGALVWIHDYHLHLVPARLRELRPDLRIGFFLHIPFPPPELFARLPWAGELLDGTLGADLIGFHTDEFVENFRRAVDTRAPQPRVARASAPATASAPHIDAYPISVDVRTLREIAASPSIQDAAQEIRAQLGGRRVLLGVDRLDYTKGIVDRLETFRDMLRSGQLEPDRCALVQIAVPSRANLPQYRDHRSEVERLVGQINGEFGSIAHQPVHYLYQSFAMRRLMPYYLAADVMLVTPLRDGMNLVAKEFAISRGYDSRGRLVLSRFAGAAAELTDALLVNPFDRSEFVDAIRTALDMPGDEAQRRMDGLARAVESSDVRAWAERFVGDLAAVPARAPRRGSPTRKRSAPVEPRGRSDGVRKRRASPVARDPGPCPPPFPFHTPNQRDSKHGHL